VELFVPDLFERLHQVEGEIPRERLSHKVRNKDRNPPRIHVGEIGTLFEKREPGVDEVGHFQDLDSGLSPDSLSSRGVVFAWHGREEVRFWRYGVFKRKLTSWKLRRTGPR
jgi:hypothetical protein